MLEDNEKLAAVAWDPDPNRATKYAKALSAKLYKIHYLSFQRPLIAPIKYVPQTLKTWQVLVKQRPSVIYSVNPPVFLDLCVYMYCLVSGARFVMDTHTPALFSPRWKWTVPLQRFLAKRALVNIVDQVWVKEMFESWGASTALLEKPLGTPYEGPVKEDVAEQFSITVVNLFQRDEPVWPILHAAKLVPEVHFYILGDTKLADPKLLQAAPENVTYTGYLSDDYWSQLYSSRAVMGLTTDEYSLLAAVQDGMAVRRPIITSRQPALTEYFTKGTVFVEHTPESIVKAVREVQQNEERLKQEIAELAEEKRERWDSVFAELQRKIGEVVAGYYPVN